MIGEYTKRPVNVQAIHLDSPEMFTVAHAWITKNNGEATLVSMDLWDDPLLGSRLFIYTLEGTMRAEAYDWIIRGVQGEFYPCKPDIFETTYQETDQKAAN